MDFIESVLVEIIAGITVAILGAAVGFVINEIRLTRRKKRTFERHASSLPPENQLEETGGSNNSLPEVLIGGSVSIIVSVALVYASYLVGLDLGNGSLIGKALGVGAGLILSIVSSIVIFSFLPFVLIGVLGIAFVVSVILLISFLVYLFATHVIDFPVTYMECFWPIAGFIVVGILFYLLSKVGPH